MAALSTFELEQRMRPGAFSRSGFLGPNESLEAVLQLDAQVLTLLGVTHLRIADTLEQVIHSGFDVFARKLKGSGATQKPAARTELCGQPGCFWLTQPAMAEDQPAPGAEPYPTRVDTRGERCGCPFEHLWFSFLLYCGYQTCPWGCGMCRWSDLDFSIEDERSGDIVRAPGLIVHLIREHQFFEGLESPYRVNPMKLITVLGLRQHAADR